MNPTRSVWEHTLQHEGRIFLTWDNEKAFNCVVRRVTDKRDGADWLNVYVPDLSTLGPGTVLAMGDSNYLVVSQDHRDNGIYRRYNAVRCNQIISFYRTEKSTTPNEWGEYETVTVKLSETPCYCTTSLAGVLRSQNVNLENSKIYVVMRAQSINLNTTTKIKRLDSSSVLVDAELKIESVDTSDCTADDAGNPAGIMRLQLSP